MSEGVARVRGIQYHPLALLRLFRIQCLDLRLRRDRPAYPCGPYQILKLYKEVLQGLELSPTRLSKI